MADTKLNADLVLRRAFDETTDKLRVDAEVTASIGTVETIIDADSGDTIAVKDPVSGNIQKINGDGSIDANVIVDRVSDSITTFTGDEAFILDNTSTTNVIYFGFAAIGESTSNAVWKIFILDKTSGLVKTYADGNSNYDNVWDDRVSLTYL